MNLKLLVNTFTDRMKTYVETHSDPKSPEEIMEIIRGCYSSLRLQLVDDLDISSRFEEDDTLRSHMSSLLELINERKMRMENDI
jgi:hypothetical protein